MMRGVLSFAILASVICFPWPLAALSALAFAIVEPLVPLATGVFADTLYYAPSAHSLPLFALGGAAVTLVALFVRSRLRTGIMGE